MAERNNVTGSDAAVSHAFCKLLVAIGDHSISYIANNLASPTLVASKPLVPNSPHSRASIVQKFIQILMAYTSLPGYYGVDEEDSEMTLGFWYLLQEALWSADYSHEAGEETVIDSDDVSEKQKEHWAIVKAVYNELMKVLKKKVAWPASEHLIGWTSGEKFHKKYPRRSQKVFPPW